MFQRQLAPAKEKAEVEGPIFGGGKRDFGSANVTRKNRVVRGPISGGLFIASLARPLVTHSGRTMGLHPRGKFTQHSLHRCTPIRQFALAEE